MSSQEDKQKKRLRIRNHMVKDLRTPKYRKRVVETKKRKQDISRLSFGDLVKAIQEDEEFK